MTEPVDPSPEQIRDCLHAGMCPFCAKGPFRAPATHINKVHGIGGFDLRDMAGLTAGATICSPELSQIRREAALAHPEKLDKMRAKWQPASRMTHAGRENHSANSRSRAADPAFIEARNRGLAKGRERMKSDPDVRRKMSESAKARAAREPDRGKRLRQLVTTPEAKAKWRASMEKVWSHDTPEVQATD